MPHSGPFAAAAALSVLCALASAAPSAAQAPATPSRHPITHEDLWLMRRVGAPVPSPDGRWVVFPVTEPAYDEKDEVADLWIAPADGSAPPRRLTAGKGRESEPAWSPDGRRLTFVAKRDGDDAAQVYLLDVAAGGEARRVTELATGARSPRWRPDGRALVVTATVYPGATDDSSNRRIASERKTRKYHARVYDALPTRYWDRWLDDARPHPIVVDPDGAPPRDLLAGTRLARLPGFGGRLTDEAEVLDATWTPDGSGVVFAATTDRDSSAHALTRADLFLVPAAGGEPRRLTPGPDSYSQPRFTPDGRTLLAVVNARRGKIYSLNRLASFPWPGLERRTIVTATLDRSVSSWAVTPKSDSVYLLAEDAGHEQLYAVGLGGGEVRLAHRPAEGVYRDLAAPPAAPATLLLARWESAVHPAEIFRVDPAGRRSALSDFNGDRIAALDWQPVRHFTFRSRRGRDIHNMLVLPPAFDSTRKYPLLVLMHGGPNTMWRDEFVLRWNYHLLAAPGYVVLLTDYTGSSGYGEAFAQAIEGDPLATPGDEINQAADEAIRRYPFIDGARQCAAGASYGGHLANWMEATTTRYRCLVSHAGLVSQESQWATSDINYPREVANGGPPWEEGRVWREQNPVRRARQFRTPMLVTVGERDFRVPMNNALETFTLLQRLRVPSRLIVFPEENHWILKGEDSRFFYAEVRAWLAKYLQGGTSPPPQVTAP